jgi:hypothetical protein
MSLNTVLGNCTSKPFGVFGLGSGDLLAPFSAWNDSWSSIFGDSAGELTVKAWIVKSKVVQDQMTGTGNILDLQRIVDVMTRTTLAARDALAAGRITAAQATDYESAFNAAWP